MITRLCFCAAALAAVSAMTIPALAFAEVVGRVLMSAGETSALREGKVIPLTYGSPVDSRDTLQTGPRSNMQIRFTDESIISLREQTRLQIEDFKYAAKEGGDESAVFRLVKGAFRTVTGLIGRSNLSRYAVRTPSATIGIRGTMYAAGVCDKDCFNADGTLARDGVYGMVIGQSHGTKRLALTNKTGETVLRPGQVFFVANEASAPELLLEPPAHLIDSLAGAGNATRPTAAALGVPGDEKKASEELASFGTGAAGGISTDREPNAFPEILDSVIALAIIDGTAPPEIPRLGLPTEGGAVAVSLGTSTNSDAIRGLSGGGSLGGLGTLVAGMNIGSTGGPSVLTLNVSNTFVNIGGTGIVRGQMLWTTTADMDLHMLTPDNQHVFFANPTVNFPATSPTATAQLDIDNTQGINHPTAVTTFQGQLHAVENIRVTGTTIPAGNYTFFTRNFSGVTTAPILLVTGDNGVTSRRFDVPALTSGATSQNYIVNRSASGTATYSGPQ